MRVVLVSDWWAPRIGGIESQLTDLARELARRGHAVRVLTTTATPAPVPGVAVEHVAAPMLGDVVVPDLRRIPQLADIIAAAGAPDVVHAHGMFSPLAIGALLAARRLGVPSVATVHSLLAPWPVFAAARAIFFAFTNRASVLTGVSRAVVSDVERASKRCALVVPNGLDVEAWRVERSGLDSEVGVLAVLRLVPKKRPRDVIDAFESAGRTASAVSMTLTIAGDGPMRQVLASDVARRGLDRRVTFAGNCSRERVRAMLARASIVVHPGRSEAFGLALLEARAAGVPVVAMRAGGVPEVVEHGRTGLLADTAAELAAHLSALASDAPLRARMSAASREGLDTFGWNAVATEYEAVYRRAQAAVRPATAAVAIE